MGEHRRSPARRARWIAVAGSGLALGAALLPVTATAADKDCSDFDSRAQAQRVLDADTSDPHRLDSDSDGLACEDLPGASTAKSASNGTTTEQRADARTDDTEFTSSSLVPVGAADTGDGSSL